MNSVNTMNTTTDPTTPLTEPTHRHSPLTPEDAGRIVAPQAPVWHPDGTRVAYSTALLVSEGEGTDSNLYEAGVDLPSRRLTHEGYSHSPTWSPDGQTLAFLSTRFGEAGLHPMDGRGGESHRLLRFPGTPRSLAWAPDSRHVVVEVLTPPPSGDPRVVRRLRYDLNGTGFLGDRVWQVQVIDTATGSTTIVGPPDHHHWYPRWAADGRLALVTSRRPDWDLEWVWDVYVVDWRADQWTCLTASDGVSLMPTLSRDGARVACLHNHSSTTSSTADYHLHVVPSRGQYAGELSDGRWLWQGHVAGQQWLLATGPDGATLPW
jgi:Tol biopolymer transport system component